MRIHRLILRNYRGIDEYQLEFPERGVVVIEGENETGKSSIAEALWLVFEVLDSANTELVRSIKPVDRDVAAEVEVEVSTGPYRFTLTKRFHRGQKTELQIDAPRPEHVSGRMAHDRVTEILKETTDTALWSALRLLQGDGLGGVPIDGSKTLARALDEAAAANLGGDREQTLAERAHREFLQYFTETGRENRAFTEARSSEVEAQDRRDQLAGRIVTLETTAERCAALEAKLSALEARRIELDREAASLAEVDSRRREATNRAEQEDTRTRLALVEQDKLVAERAGRLSLMEAAERARAGLTDLRPARDAATRAVEAAEGAWRERKSEAELASAASEHHREAAKLAIADLGHFQEALQAEQMAERLDRVRQAEGRLRELVGTLNASRTNQRLLGEIEEAQRAADMAAARLEAAGVSVEVLSETAAEIAVNGSQVDVAAGEAYTATVGGETSIELPGGFRVTVRPGLGAGPLEADMAARRARLGELLAAAGVTSLEEAREAERGRAAADAERGQLRKQMEQDLRDLTSDSLAAKLDSARERVSRYDATRPAGFAMPATWDEARARSERAEEDERGSREKADGALQSLRDAEAILERCRHELAEHDRQAAEMEQTIAQSEKELAEARERADEATLAAEIERAEAEVAAARDRLDEARAVLRTAPDVAEQLAQVRSALQAAMAEIRTTEYELAAERTRLEDAGESGLHHRLQEAESAHEAALANLESLQSRAGAAKLLHETLKRHRELAQEAYALPLQQELEELGRRVFGPSFAVELGNDLDVARRTLNGVTLEFSRLSAGTREQLGILLRVACARLVSKAGGVPLVLDDVLGWSDPHRLEQMGAVLGLAAEETQVVLLTCTPGRFARVSPATFISLPSGAGGESSQGDEAPRAPAVPAAPERRRPAEQGAFALGGDEAG